MDKSVTMSGKTNPKKNGRHNSHSISSSGNSSTPNSLHKVSNWMNSFLELGKDVLLRNQHDDDCSSISNSSSTSPPHKRPKSAPIFSSAIRRTPKRPSKKLDFEDLSPESEKKKELCSYLQLMKPTDKVTIVNLENRRSIRVKYLNNIQRKPVKCPDLFHFPVPVDQLRHKICDFNLTEEDWFVQCRKERFPPKGKVLNGRNGVKNFTFPNPPNILANGIVHFGVKEHGFKGFVKGAEDDNNRLAQLIQRLSSKKSVVQKHNMFKDRGFKIRIVPKKRKRQSVEKQTVSPILAIFKDQPPCVSDNPKNFHCEILNIERDEEMHNLFNGVSPCASPSRQNLKSSHCIKILDFGKIINIFYIDYNLVICQESLVSVWTQTALGNILGAQNMWLNRGSVQRLCMNNNCTFKGAKDMVVSAEGSLAYVELWTKEHQSVMRQGPVADVFATVYYIRKGMKHLEKKVLQLENINGFAEDVQYSVLKSSRKIIVSWHLATTDIDLRKTCVACYQLSSDFQSICKNREFESVQHYVSSLHNIEGSDTIITGSGEDKITLWNVERGHVAATIEMSELRAPLTTLWVKCDRGFLFTLQECIDCELRLIAINGMDHSWKKLASYFPPNGYKRLKGISLENGVVLGLYDGGIVVWNAQSSEIITECKQSAEFISGKFLIDIVDDQIVLRHPFAQLLR